MNIIKKRSALGLAAALAVSLAGCGGSGAGSDPVVDGMGTLNLSVSDAPIDAEKVCIKFDGVQLKKADDSPPFDIDFIDPVVINLMANQGAVSETLVSTEVEAGNYQWIRLMVDAATGNGAGAGDTGSNDPDCDPMSNGSYLVTKTNELYNIRIPSGDQTGLKLIKDIVIPVNGSGNYTAEWDLGRSFIAPPGFGTGEAMMKPVVKLVANNEVGTLFGAVADALASPDPADPAICDTVNGFGPTIHVFDDNDDLEDPVNGEDGSIEPVATGPVDQEMQGSPFTYEIGFLLAGDYEVAFTCDGETFIPATGKAATIAVGESFELNFDADDLPATE